MTTGMSAPPIGSTNITPKRRASPSRATSTHSASAPATRATPSPAAPSTVAALTTFCARKDDRAARDELLQLREGHERARERDRADECGEDDRDELLPCERPSATWNSASATSAAAPPPTPLKRATICGIAVIFTVRAPITPTTVPIAAPPMMSGQLPIPSSSSVVAIAIAIPAPPTQLPLRACFGDERNRSATMKLTIAAR